MRHALKLSGTFSHKTCTVRIYRDLLHLWKLSPAPSCMCFLLRRLDWKTRFAKIFSSSISIVPEFVIRTTSMSHFSLSFVFIFFSLGKEQKKAFWYIFGIELRYLVSLSALFFCKNYEFLLTFLSKSIRCVLLSIRILQQHKIKCSVLAQRAHRII